MEFRLIYRGPLPSQQDKGNGRVKYKQAIRKQIHPQLRALWSQNKWLGKPEDVAKNFDQFGYRFVPLVSKAECSQCSLHILFLRRDAPGNLVRSGGDIDNRIKVLIDGLKKPGEHSHIGSDTPAQGEDPFYCLLEDDALITEIHIVTDRLLTPPADGEGINDVEIVIQVKTDHDMARRSKYVEGIKDLATLGVIGFD